MLFTLGAYGVAAGAATGQEAVVAVGVFAFTLFVDRDRLADPGRSPGSTSSAIAPTDATVGDAVELRITITGRASRLDVRALDPPGAWWRTSAPADGRLAAHRDAARRVPIGARAAAHLGAARRLRAHAHGPRRAAGADPRRAAPERRAPRCCNRFPTSASSSGSPLLVRGGGDTVRAVRPYAPGDPARLVHWPTSARRGEIVVREHEPPPALGVALVVDLRGTDPRGRREPGRGHRHRHARRGRRRLVRHVRGRRARRRDGRRRARTSGAASPAPPPARPPTAPDHWPTEVVHGMSSRRALGRRREPRRAGRARRSGSSRSPPRSRSGRSAAIAAEHARLPVDPRRARRARSRPRSACSRCRRSRPGAPPSCSSVSAGSPRCGTRRSRAPTAAGCSCSGPRPRCSRSCSSTGPTPRPCPRSTAAHRCRAGSPETARVGAIIAVVVAVAAVALVPTVTAAARAPRVARAAAERRRRPSARRRRCTRAASSSLTTRPRLSDAVVFTVDAAHADFWRGETFDVYHGSRAGSNSRRRRRPHDFLPHDDGTQGRRSRPRRTTSARETGTEFRQTFHVEARVLRRRVRGAEPACRRDRQAPERAARRHRPRRELPVADRASARARCTPCTAAACRSPRRRCARPIATPVPDRDQRSSTRSRRARPPRVAELARAITAERDDHVRQGPRDRELARREHAVLAERAAVAAGRRRRRRLLVPQPARLVRADREQPRRAGAQRRDPGPARHRLRAGRPRRAHRPLRGAREGRARVGRDLLPGIGWQGFDPTASVPLAGDAKPGGSWLTDARRNAVPLAIASALLIALIAASCPRSSRRSRRRRARRASWSASALHRLERVGRKAGRARAPVGDAARVRATRSRSASATTASPRSATRSTPTCSRRTARPRRDRANADAVLTSLRP